MKNNRFGPICGAFSGGYLLPDGKILLDGEEVTEDELRSIAKKDLGEIQLAECVHAPNLFRERLAQKCAKNILAALDKE